MTGSGNVTLVEETGSTNADLALALRSGESLSEGHWRVARRQTAGKGRQGREWFDGSGNFMGSTVVEIRAGDPPPASLSFVAALAVAQVVGAALGGACAPRLKWPNDVSLDGGKAAGILLEMVGQHVIVGIGVNIARAPDLPDRKTAALADFAAPPAVDEFAGALEAAFATWLRTWRDQGLPKILQTFLHASEHHSGASICVHDTDGSRVLGTFAGLEDSDGALRLRLADGSERVIRAGDIS